MTSCDIIIISHSTKYPLTGRMIIATYYLIIAYSLGELYDTMLGIYSPRSSHPRVDSLESSHPRIEALHGELSS